MSQTPSNILHFDNRLVAQLPADPVRENYPRQVTGAAYSHALPVSVRAPKLIALAPEVADLLGLTPTECASEVMLQVLAGNQLLVGMQPHACCYGGHQFGNWAGQLGDGRAINLGEVINTRGDYWTLQLKGAGPTPYSRTADGLAVLRSSVREFLCSEAMHHLGVPSTRALSLVVTGEQVMRDMFYDGHPGLEPSAVVARVAPNFIRFGNFELAAARGDLTLLQQWADFTIRTSFPELGEPSAEVYGVWLAEVARRTAHMIAHWMRVGFVHGVMNTDNMSILGLTIDYGPYGWLENFDPNWTPNTTDAQHRRYRFGNQPQVALWNLAQLANALYPLINTVAPLEAALDVYRAEYAQAWQTNMANKLGLHNFIADDQDLVTELEKLMTVIEADMTIFYRCLAKFELHGEDYSAEAPVERVSIASCAFLMPAYYQPLSDEQQQQVCAWLTRYRQRLLQDWVIYGRSDAERRTQMNTVNPKYVLRNYLAQQAIEQATLGDYSMIQNLLTVLRRPYDEQPDFEYLFAKRPEWARTKAGCSMLSCSS